MAAQGLNAEVGWGLPKIADHSSASSHRDDQKDAAIVMDPTVSLAVSVRANPGVYALLLGSGVSRAASVPTGWDIVLDLIRQVARLRGKSPEPDPDAWYQQTFGREVDYSDLLEVLAKRPAERGQLLRAYIEPSEEERDLGLKVPTEAHRAIAELVAHGYVKVIITTNFDRLLETALSDVGITPTVLDSPDAIEGALPLVHTRCAVLKVHGDYMDARIRNTVAELERYPGPLDQILDRVLDEYGLIVCGWSAEWDRALRAAIERCPTRRFATYWATRGEPGPAAQRLIQHRGADVIKIADADAFFRRLSDDVTSLEDMDRPELLSVRMATTAFRRYLDDPARRIRLRDLLMAEANRVHREVEVEPAAIRTAPVTPEEVAARVQRYEGLTEVLRALLTTGGYWGEPAHESHWVTCLDRVANIPETGGYDPWLALRRYPALLALYAVGLGAVAQGRYRTLAALAERVQVRREGGRNFEPLVVAVSTARVFEPPVVERLYPEHRRIAPVSWHLFFTEGLWQVLRNEVPDDVRFIETFDRFEYLLGLIHTDWMQRLGRNPWGPVGCFVWRNSSLNDLPRVAQQVEAEVAEAQFGWPPLTAGLFGGELARLQDAMGHYHQWIARRVS